MSEMMNIKNLEWKAVSNTFTSLQYTTIGIEDEFDISLNEYGYILGRYGEGTGHDYHEYEAGSVQEAKSMAEDFNRESVKRINEQLKEWVRQ